MVHSHAGKGRFRDSLFDSISATSAPEAPTATLVVVAREDLQIALEVRELLGGELEKRVGQLRIAGLPAGDPFRLLAIRSGSGKIQGIPRVAISRWLASLRSPTSQ